MEFPLPKQISQHCSPRSLLPDRVNPGSRAAPDSDSDHVDWLVSKPTVFDSAVGTNFFHELEVGLSIVPWAKPVGVVEIIGL